MSALTQKGVPAGAAPASSLSCPPAPALRAPSCPSPVVEAMARGWCPGLSRPMASGDGLLARVHPPNGILSPRQALALGEAARICGNGLLDITSHANLQIRGVRAETLGPLRARLTPLGLDDAGRRAPYRATVISPLAGLDESEQVDGRTLADLVEAIVRTVRLPPKFLIGVESGGRIALDHLAPDLRLIASAPGQVRLVLAGVPALTSPPLPVAHMLELLPRLLQAISAMLHAVNRRRVRMLTGNARRALLVQAGFASTARLSPDDGNGDGQPRLAAGMSLLQGTSLAPHLSRPKMPRAGTCRLANGTFALFAAPPFGQMTARALESIGLLAQELGLEEIRLTPLRGLLLPGLNAAHLAMAQARLSAHGLITRAEDPRLRIITCAGAPACARARCNSHALASQLARHLAPAPGREADIHLSACMKGCARRGRSPLTVVAQGERFAIIPDGGPLDTPRQHLSFPELLAQLATLVPHSPHDESR